MNVDRYRRAVFAWLLLTFFVYSFAQTDLSVSGSGSELYPAFSHEIERYYVILGEDESSLEVSSTSPDGAAWLLNGEPLTDAQITAPEAGDTLTFELTADGAVQNRYEVQLLPSDFPKLEVTTRTDAVSEGYVFITPGIDPGPGYRIIADNHGVPVWYEQGRSYDLKRHPNGQYSYARLADVANQHDRVDHDIIVLDENLERVRRYSAYNLNHTTHHDFLLLEGSVVMLAYAGAYRDLTEFGGGIDDLVEDTILQEVDSDGNLVLQWNSWGDAVYDERLRPDPKDYAHGNAVFLEPDGESYLLSLRSHSQVLKIDRESGDVIWKLGGINGDFTFPNEGDVFCGQHTPSRLDNDNILIFDNGQFCPPDAEERGTTRVAEYRLDEEAMTAELVWSYEHDTVYSIAQGSAQRLDNGHTFIGWGMGQRNPITIGPEVLASEVDAEGNVVWEMTAFYTGQFGESEEVQTLPANSYRAWRFPVERLP